MLFSWIAACVYFSSVRYSEQKSTPADRDYVAAVVEFQVTKNTSRGLNQYVHNIKKAAEKGADIVVFPELTLVRKSNCITVPIYGLLETYPVPALHPALYDKPLVAISKAARDNDIYVVINIPEKMDCNDAPQEYCPEKKFYWFVTNVVFDRTGNIIDRHRKMHPLHAAAESPALKADLGVFSTDFGVTFGHLICMDILYQVPAVQIVSKLNIKNIIFTTMWRSHMPYFTTVDFQQAYAYAMDVNFLAANANNIKLGIAGSGIYSGKYGALVSVMPGVAGTRFLVAKVPKNPGEVDTSDVIQGPIFDDPSDPDGLVLYKDHTFLRGTSKILRTGYQAFTIIDNDVTCKITATLKRLNTAKGHKYRGFVYHGTMRTRKETLGVASCSVLACENEDLNSCPHRFSNNDINFEELKIEMSTVRGSYNESLQCQNIQYFPASLRINKFPLDPTNFTYKEEIKDTGHELITYKLKTPQNDLISFGIWGRIYSDDAIVEDIPAEDVNYYYY